MGVLYTVYSESSRVEDSDVIDVDKAMGGVMALPPGALSSSRGDSVNLTDVHLGISAFKGREKVVGVRLREVNSLAPKIFKGSKRSLW